MDKISTYLSTSRNNTPYEVPTMSRRTFDIRSVPHPKSPIVDHWVIDRIQRKIVAYEIAQQLIAHSTDVKFGIPIRLQHNYQATGISRPDHFAFLIQFTNNALTILPCAIWAIGLVSSAASFHCSNFQQNYAHTWEDVLLPLEKKHWPILSVLDVIFYDKKTNRYAEQDARQQRAFENV
jgi:hypothetical protein